VANLNNKIFFKDAVFLLWNILKIKNIIKILIIFSKYEVKIMNFKEIKAFL